MNEDDKKWIENYVKGYEFPHHSAELKSRILSSLNDKKSDMNDYYPAHLKAGFHLGRRAWVSLCLALLIGIASSFLNSSDHMNTRTFDGPFYFGFSTNVAENILNTGVQNDVHEKS